MAQKTKDELGKELEEVKGKAASLESEKQRLERRVEILEANNEELDQDVEKKKEEIERNEDRIEKLEDTLQNDCLDRKTAEFFGKLITDTLEKVAGRLKITIPPSKNY